jgi:MFS transporter, ACS family, solute carrier family 17 (sodium-dependent inorganic phosphate cotransporter), other
MNDVTSLPAWGRRHSVLAMCFVAMFIAYSDRVNISVASVAMLEELHWNETVKGTVLSAFFIGYLLFMIPAGWLAERYGGKRVLACAVIWWSVCTLITPWAASVSLPVLIAARIGLGLGEAAVLPATYELFSRWVAAPERSRAMTRFLSGIPVGQIAGFVVTGWLTGHYGWPTSFYLFGAIGLAWAVTWLRGFDNDPASDRRITPEECKSLRATTGQSAQALPPVWPLLGKASVWAIFVAHFSANWVLYLLIAWLPSYFHAMGLNYTNAGIYSAAPWLSALIVSNTAATLADRAIVRGVSILKVRRIVMGISLLGAAACLMLVRTAETPVQALILVCAAASAVGVGWSGFAPNLLDIAPRHGAILISFSNTFATIPGIAGVWITGWLLDRTGSYSATFLLTAGIATAGAVFYFLFASAKRVDT